MILENRGIDFCWTESDLYGPVTVMQIFGKALKRGMDAHIITIQALSMLHQEAFLNDQKDLFKQLSAATEELDNSFTSQDQEVIRNAHSAMIQIIKSGTY